jgi:hypothetical protein
VGGAYFFSFVVVSAGQEFEAVLVVVVAVSARRLSRVVDRVIEKILRVRTTDGVLMNVWAPSLVARRLLFVIR